MVVVKRIFKKMKNRKFLKIYYHLTNLEAISNDFLLSYGLNNESSSYLAKERKGKN